MKFTEEDRKKADAELLKAALEEIVELRAAEATPANRQLLGDCLKSFSLQLQESQDNIPADILEPLGPEDRRAALLSFCNLVAVSMIQAQPAPDAAALIVKAPSRIIRPK